MDCTGSDVPVNHNTVDGTGSPVNIAANGIEIADGAVGEVDHNVVSGNECLSNTSCGPNLDAQYQASGIALIGSNVEVDHNDVSGNDMGIALSPANGAHVDHNQLTNNRYGAIVLFYSSSNTIDHNQIKGDNQIAPYTAGIDILVSSNNNNVNHNQVQVTSVPSIYVDGTSTGNVLSNNS